MAAANESQGLKIAVAAFVTLTVILAVTSYFLYSSYSRTEGLLQSETEKASKSQRNASEALNQYEEFRKMVGVRADEFDPAKTEVTTHFTKVDERLGGIANAINAALAKAQGAGAQGQELEEAKQRIQQLVASYRNEPNKNYISSLDRLLELLESTALVDSELAVNYQALRHNLESATSVAKQQIDVQTKSASDSKTDLEAEHTKHEQERQILLTKVDQLTTELDQAKTELANLSTQNRQQSEEFTRKNEMLTAMLREQRAQLDLRETVLDRPDGHITYVDFDRNEVHVDVNRRQGARPQMKMTIFDANSAGIPTEKPKGTIELVQVGDQYSIARILKTNSPIEPLRIGDIVYSPAWSPDEPMRFALIGKIDVNRDGKDDRDDLKRMIEAAGGTVDYDLPPPDAGRESGKLTPRISWYVVDDPVKRPPLRDVYSKPSDETIAAQANFEKRKGEMIKEARNNGSRPIDISRLLSYLGYDMNTPIIGRAEAVNQPALDRLTAPKPKTDAQKAADAAKLSEQPEAADANEPKPEADQPK
jgi:hypothetical protein